MSLTPVRRFILIPTLRQIIEGELEITIGGVAQRAGPGFVAIISQDTLHSVRAISGGKAIVVDYPLRQQV